MVIDYSTVTEIVGEPVSREAAAMMRERYQFVAEHVAGQDVLEVSCGTGQGLGVTAHVARRVVGLDITYSSLAVAQRHYRGRVPLLHGDAQALPFAPGVFDAVAIHEAVYYFQNLSAALAETRRVLRPAGRLFVSTINPAWSDFNPSPFAVAHLDSRKLRQALERHFPRVELFGAFPAHASGVKGKAVSAARRLAVAGGLIPRTMQGKRLLKRLAYGELVSVPAEIEPSNQPATCEALAPGDAPVSDFKVLYAIAYHS